jgi:Xaa-Pro dipeptidase
MTAKPSTPKWTPDFNQHERLVFSREEYMRRYNLVLDLMKKAGVDAMLIRGPENITYLTGYETPGYYGYHCLVVAAGEQPVLIGRWLELASNIPEYSWLTKSIVVDDHQVPVRVTTDVVRQLGLDRGTLGIEKDGYFFNVSEFDALVSAAPEAKFVNISGMVEEARMVKSNQEVEIIRKAVAIADRAVLAGIKAVEPCMTENDVAAEVYKVWCEEGAEYTGLPNFIAAGYRSGVCHGTWNGRRLAKDDWCCFEIGASKARYAGCIYRAVTVGNVDPEFRRLADTTVVALEALISAIKPGVVSEDVHEAGHSVFVKNGYEMYHRHRCGYSIGLNFPPDWGEGHIISIRKGEKRQLQENMTFHLTPSVLIPNKMGMCTSATVRVSATGCEVLNAVPRMLFEK